MARKRTEPRSYPGTEAGAAATPVRRRTTHKIARPSTEQFDSGSQVSALSEPAPEEIARLAYSYWEARGGTHGDDEQDWLRAEQDLRLRKSN